MPRISRVLLGGLAFAYGRGTPVGIGHNDGAEVRSSGARCDDITAEVSVGRSVHGCESCRGCHIDGAVLRVWDARCDDTIARVSVGGFALVVSGCGFRAEGSR